MKKTLIIVLTSLSFIIILDSLNAGQAITMFFLAGIIPGTNISLSATHMFELFTLLLGFTLSRLTINFLRHPAIRRSNQAVRA